MERAKISFNVSTSFFSRSSRAAALVPGMVLLLLLLLLLWVSF
jgi:hypothetical protein